MNSNMALLKLRHGKGFVKNIMYKKALSGLILVNLLFFMGYVCVSGIQLNRTASIPAYQLKLDEVYIADDKSSVMGMVTSAASGQRVVDFGTMEKAEEPFYALSDSDYDVLLRIVEAEAGGEDEDGKLLVANVVLNRMNNEKFPNTVSEVVCQRSSGVTQFSPVSSGRIWKVTVSEETVAAVDRALYGEDISQGALYFASRKYANSDKMRWFDEKLTFLFKHGGHEFFRE